MATIRPLNRNVLVKLDSLEKLHNGLILANGIDTVDIRTATVLAIGPNVMPGLSVGDKVAFHRWHTEHKSGKSIVATLDKYGEDLALVQDIDIFFAFDSDAEISFA